MVDKNSNDRPPRALTPLEKLKEELRVKSEALSIMSEQRDRLMNEMQQFRAAQEQHERESKSKIEALHTEALEMTAKLMRYAELWALVETIVPQFAREWLATYQNFSDNALSLQAQQMRREARELLNLLGAEE